jgi:adenine-specific DNA-methyltransferase
MDKLKMQTTNVVDENIKKIGELFPNCLTERLNDEGKPEVAIDFDQLRQELSKDIVEGPEERYQFTWPDKRNAIRLANAPTTDTLRPCREESVNFDTTQNLYIEGDNLEVLKLLRENYLGKVKMIYIDPPYNTGNDFVYNDDFAQSAGEYVHNSGQEDEEGNRLVTNTESNGRFHTDWLNMIYPRLKVAKDLLSEDGVIFISIDENEIENLKKVCNEVLGVSNIVGTFIWRKKNGGGQAKDYFVIEHEYIVVYRKSDKFIWQDKIEARDISEFNKKDERGAFKVTKLAKWGNTARREDRPTMYFPIISPDGSDVFPIAPDGGDGRWRIGKPKMDELFNNELVYWEKKNGSWIPYEKEYFDGQSRTIKDRSILYDLANTGDGSNELTSLFGRKDTFENPKPSIMLKFFMQATTSPGSIILDFFSGSATTAHAVMQLNAEDGGNRKFIMVQLPETTDEKSEAYKAGYKNICEIGKERIRRAGKKIKEESPLTTQDLDTGFRVLKLDSSNMEDVYYTPENFTQQSLFNDNIKQDRTEEDLLFQAMIELGIELSAKIEKTQIAGKTVWNVSDGYLLACFDENVNESTITAIAKQQPYYFVMRDASLATDNVADNFEQIWQEYSKDTIRRIL